MALTPVTNDQISGSLFNCGNGESLCHGARGKVCLIELGGGVPFSTKAENCEDGGGVGCLFFPQEGADIAGSAPELSLSPDAFRGTIPQVTIKRKDGLALLSQTDKVKTLDFLKPAYRVMEGTSMAAPHVAAIAAKIWAVRNQCKNSEIRDALEHSARDLGVPGKDVYYGHGFVQGPAAYATVLDLPPPCGIPGGAASAGSNGNGGGSQNGNVLQYKLQKRKIARSGTKGMSGLRIGGDGRSSYYNRRGSSRVLLDTIEDGNEQGEPETPARGSTDNSGGLRLPRSRAMSQRGMI